MTTWEDDKQYYQNLRDLYTEALASCDPQDESLKRELERQRQDCESKIAQIESHIATGDSIFDTAIGQDDSPPATPTATNWTGTEKKKLREALLAVYPDYTQLQIFTADNNWPLAAVAANGDLTSVVFQLIQHLESQGLLDRGCELFLAENATNKNPKFVAFRRFWQQRQTQGDRVTRTIEPDPPDSADDDRELHAHLLVLARQGGTGDRFLTRVTLIFPNGETFERDPDLQTDDELDLALVDFPESLEDWIDRAVDALYEVADIWQLTVNLFLPTDRLAQPLALWCADRLEEWERDRIALVVRCANRFDKRERRARRLQGSLNRRRQSFRQSLPDASTPLKHLTWASPSDGRFTREHTALRCTCDWLCGSACDASWLDLIDSGIPLALWTYAQTTATDTIDTTYDRLLESDRAAFYPAICEIRHPINADGFRALGVFYEGDTNRYDPKVPKQAS